MNKADKFLELYNNGLTLEQIGQRFNISRQEVQEALSKHPDYIPMSRNRRNDRRNQEMIATYTKNKSVELTAEKFGVNRSTAYRIISNDLYKQKQSRNQKIIWMYNNMRKMKVVEIAEMFGIGPGSVYRIVGNGVNRRKNSTDCREK